MINGCDQDDRGLYKITIAGSFGVGGRTFPTAFNFRDVLYISKFECRNKECPKENTYQAGECTGPVCATYFFLLLLLFFWGGNPVPSPSHSTSD